MIHKGKWVVISLVAIVVVVVFIILLSRNTTPESPGAPSSSPPQGAVNTERGPLKIAPEEARQAMLSTSKLTFPAVTSRVSQAGTPLELTPLIPDAAASLKAYTVKYTDGTKGSEVEFILEKSDVGEFYRGYATYVVNNDWKIIGGGYTDLFAFVEATQGSQKARIEIIRKNSTQLAVTIRGILGKE